ncbi:unnamed protein product [Dicrocoelium dendriticum]|nr:unnamed protein product [Dicrocoelium dendriticum]
MLAVEQKDWMFGAINCDERKLTHMLNENPNLATWQSYLDGTALHFAAKFGNCALVRILVGNHQADVNKRNFAGLTPLHMAAANAQRDAIILLTSTYGASIGLRDHSGRLPGEYLPPTKAGMELKKFFMDGTSLLLTRSTGKKLFELLLPRSSPNGPPDERRSRSRSPVVREVRNSSLPSPNAPTSAQFPWHHDHRESMDASHSSRDSSLTRLTQCVHPSRSRDRSKEKPKKLVPHTVSTIAALAGASLRHRQSAGKARSTHATVSGAILAEDIYASVRMKKEFTRVKYSPLNTEQKQTGNSDNSNRSPISKRSMAAGRRHQQLPSFGSSLLNGSDSSSSNQLVADDRNSSVSLNDAQSESSGSKTPTNAP